MWPWSRIAGLKRALQEALDESDRWESRAVSADRRNDRLVQEVERLSKALAEAAKNDTRDPKSGRFVKAS